MALPRLHLLGIPHTVTRSEWSHCAFTGKVQRFSPMMRSVGYHVTHYGNEGSESGADEHVDILTREELTGFVGPHDPASPKMYGDLANVSTPCYRLFNERAHEALGSRVQPGDIVCFPFGHAHAGALEGPHAEAIARAYFIETGIGYETTFAQFKVFESQAWMHWHLGRAGRPGSDYEWVIPNYYDVSEWEPSVAPGKYLLYFGRLGAAKGLDIVMEVAKARPDLHVVICGQGDPGPYLALGLPNVEYRAPIWEKARRDLYAGAIATLCPSRYVEPFGGVAVESMLCGTPVLASAFGAFTETVGGGSGGIACRTLGDWLAGVDAAQYLWRPDVRGFSGHRFDMLRIAHEYARVFRQVADLGGEGWYTRRPVSL